MKYKIWLEEWLKNYVQTTNKERTYRHYSNIVSLHIIPHLGDYELIELSPLLLQKFVSELTLSGNKKTNKGLSPNFVKSVISVIQNSLRTAHMLGLTTEYVADKIKRPRIVEKKVECFSITEQKTIESYIMQCEKRKLKGIILCLYTGLRIGELLALTWSNIDFTKGILSLTKTCHDGNIDGIHCVIVDTPKTENSRRYIPLSKPLLAILKELKRKAQANM